MTSRAQMIPAPIFCTALLACFLLLGCGDTCFTITGIFFNTSSSSNPATCQLTNANGNIDVGINSATAPSVAPMAPNLRHIFVSIRGVEANPDALAAEDSPDWQELAPELESEPVQIDLMASPASDALCASRIARKATVRADLYRQVRLRLVSDQPAAGAPKPRHNECIGLGFNCVVDINGRAHSLTLKSGVHDFLIPSDRIPDGFFNVFPDTETHLSIVFDPYATLSVGAGDAVQISPVFSAEVLTSCSSRSSP